MWRVESVDDIKTRVRDLEMQVERIKEAEIEVGKIAEGLTKSLVMEGMVEGMKDAEEAAREFSSSLEPLSQKEIEEVPKKDEPMMEAYEAHLRSITRPITSSTMEDIDLKI